MSRNSSGVDLKLFHEVQEYLHKAEKTPAVSPKNRGYAYFSFPFVPKNSFDLVYERIYLGQASVALNIKQLKALGVTHVVNCCKGNKLSQTNTDAAFYKKDGITFHGIPALDLPCFNMLPYLRPAAEFMHKALQSGGILYVHCQQGVSRSATVVIAYLMLYQNMGLAEAVKTVRTKREIFPNDGFLKQLCILDKELKSTKGSCISPVAIVSSV